MHEPSLDIYNALLDDALDLFWDCVDDDDPLCPLCAVCEVVASYPPEVARAALAQQLASMVTDLVTPEEESE